MQNRYVFRADASMEMGGGHVMRVCSIIEEMIDSDFRVVLVGQISGIPWLKDYLDLLGESLEIFEEKDFFSNPKHDVLIIDSYTLDPTQSFLDPSKWLRIVALVDSGTPKYFSDLFIHCGTNTSIERDFSIGKAKFVGGLDYIAIRKSIREINFDISKKEDLQTVRILVVGGATDPLGFVNNLAQELMGINDTINVILMNEESNSLKLLDSRFSQVKVGPGLESELTKADLIFTLAGTSSWDFLSCGFPLGIALGFENQRDNYNFQLSNGIALDIGYRSINGEFKFQTENIKELISSSQLRKRLSKKATKTVDKFGVSRIKDEIVKIST